MYLAFEGDGTTIKEWGYCLPECHSSEPMVACIDEPEFPVVVSTEDDIYVNYTANYTRGSNQVTFNVRSF